MGPKLSSAQACGHPQSECVRVGRASGSHLGARKGQGRLPPPSRSFSPHTRGHQESETSHHGTHGRTQDPAELASPPGDALGVWPLMAEFPISVPSVGAATHGATADAISGPASPRQPLDSEQGRSAGSWDKQGTSMLSLGRGR